jgi:archaellum component FlaG (FlaF/FlaG flagellin family)
MRHIEYIGVPLVFSREVIIMIKRYVIIGLFITLSMALSCGDRDTVYLCEPPVDEPEFGESMEDSIVRANCYILRDAVEAFTMDNLGEYPRSVEGDYIIGSYKDLKDYLPDERLLWNPYTWWRLEPTVEIASAPGEIGLLPIIEDDFCTGYCITGYGQDSIIVELTDTISTYERAVIENCILLRDAAENYAFDNFDEYSRSLTYGQNDSGKVLLDYLPDGDYLQNTYTGEFTEPSCLYQELLDAPGEISYRAIYMGGFYVGYEIFGYGDDAIKCRITNTLDLQDAQVLVNCYIVRWAAERFAAENGGIYPGNVGIDETLLGNTLTDLLVNSRLLMNPYTMVCSEPVDGMAVTPGATGYTTVVQNSTNVGYTITGVGKYAGITIITLCYYPGYR